MYYHWWSNLCVCKLAFHSSKLHKWEIPPFILHCPDSLLCSSPLFQSWKDRSIKWRPAAGTDELCVCGCMCVCMCVGGHSARCLQPLTENVIIGAVCNVLLSFWTLKMNILLWGAKAEHPHWFPFGAELQLIQINFKFNSDFCLLRWWWRHAESDTI